jgi:hypothetical protein
MIFEAQDDPCFTSHCKVCCLIFQVMTLFDTGASHQTVNFRRCEFQMQSRIEPPNSAGSHRTFGASFLRQIRNKLMLEKIILNHVFRDAFSYRAPQEKERGPSCFATFPGPLAAHCARKKKCVLREDRTGLCGITKNDKQEGNGKMQDRINGSAYR